jgi:hypothetical protein
MPLPAGVSGHAVFICGYKSEGSKVYLKINYGWANDKNEDGSDSNGFYLANEAQIDTWILDHVPKVTLQDENGNAVEALAIKSTVFESEVCTFPEAFIPSKDTVFTCDITDIMEEGTEIDTAVNIQLWNEVDMEWKTLVIFPHENESGEIVVPGKAIIPLGRYAERFCRTRLTLSSVL